MPRLGRGTRTCTDASRLESSIRPLGPWVFRQDADDPRAVSGQSPENTQPRKPTLSLDREFERPHIRARAVSARAEYSSVATFPCQPDAPARVRTPLVPRWRVGPACAARRVALVVRTCLAGVGFAILRFRRVGQVFAGPPFRRGSQMVGLRRLGPPYKLSRFRRLCTLNTYGGTPPVFPRLPKRHWSSTTSGTQTQPPHPDENRSTARRCRGSRR